VEGGPPSARALPVAATPGRRERRASPRARRGDAKAARSPGLPPLIQIFKPSWRPRPAAGEFSGSIGRQSCSWGRNRPRLAAKAVSGEFFLPSWPRKRRVDSAKRNFDGEEWIADLAMDSFGRQSSAKISPEPGFSANLAPKFPQSQDSLPIWRRNFPRSSFRGQSFWRGPHSRLGRP